MNGLIKALVLGAVRTFAASSGGWLVLHGYMAQDQTAGWIGSVCFIAALAFSAYDKLRVENKIDQAHATPEAAPLPFK